MVRPGVRDARRGLLLRNCHSDPFDFAHFVAFLQGRLVFEEESRRARFTGCFIPKTPFSMTDKVSALIEWALCPWILSA